MSRSLLPVIVAITIAACTARQTPVPSTALPGTVEETPLTVQTELFDEAGQSEPIYTIHAEWPVFTAHNSNLDGLNSQAQEAAQEQIDRFRLGLKDLMPMPESQGSSFRLVYTVKESPAELVAVRYEMDQYWEGGATSIRYSRTLNYSLALGRRLVLADLFGTHTEYLKRLADYANEGLGEQGYKSSPEVPLIATDASYFEAWLAVPTGIEVIFSPLICCGPAGEGQVLVPYEVFDDLIDPAYKHLWE